MVLEEERVTAAAEMVVVVGREWDLWDSWRVRDASISSGRSLTFSQLRGEHVEV